MYLLDTNVISELRRRQPDPQVVAWLRGVDDEALHLSAVTLGELQSGVEIARAQDPAKADEIEAWIDQVAATHAILPMDGAAFRLWARLMHGQPDKLIEDAMIAATALAPPDRRHPQCPRLRALRRTAPQSLRHEPQLIGPPPFQINPSLRNSATEASWGLVSASPVALPRG